MQKLTGTLLMVITGFCLNSSLVNDGKTNTSGRETVETITGETGFVRKIGDGEMVVYMIDCSAKHLRLNVVNMPLEFKKDGLTVRFSGNIKAGSPLEDDFGEYFEILSVEQHSYVATTP
jgi:hypothetical protein